MTLENQALHLENERLTAERDEAISNLDDAIQSYNSLSNTGSMIFAEINALAEQALGHTIEPGHTAVYAVELLVERLRSVTAERDRYRLALEAIAESDFAWFARIKARETLGLAGEGGGAR